MEVEVEVVVVVVAVVVGCVCVGGGGGGGSARAYDGAAQETRIVHDERPATPEAPLLEGAC